MSHAIAQLSELANVTERARLLKRAASPFAAGRRVIYPPGVEATVGCGPARAVGA